MDASPASLLKLLASGVRPDGAAPAKTAAPFESASFSSLLDLAHAGAIDSNRPVTMGPEAGVELTADQMDRLASVVDAAEASGATRLVALLDGHALTIDVATRTVESVSEQPFGNVLTNIDSVVVVPGAAGEALAAPGLDTAHTSMNLNASVQLPGLGRISNQSLAELLGRGAHAAE